MKKYQIFSLTVILITGWIFSSVSDKDKPKNLQILKFETIKETKTYMKTVSKGLGVKCIFCHNLDDFSLDTDHKKIARNMMKMTQSINEDYFTWKGARQIECRTCHQGQKEPPEK
ncbi:MAG: c-type cytochrome [Fidelibacterota bacterium]